MPAVNIRSPRVYLGCSLPGPRSQIGNRFKPPVGAGSTRPHCRPCRQPYQLPWRQCASGLASLSAARSAQGAAARPDNWSGCGRPCQTQGVCRRPRISCSLLHLLPPRICCRYAHRLRFDRDLSYSRAGAAAERFGCTLGLLVHLSLDIGVPSGPSAPAILPSPAARTMSASRRAQSASLM